MRTTVKLLVAALLLIAGLIAGFVASAWAPDLPVAQLSARWATPPSRFLPLEGMQVHLRDEGPRDDSLPVVLLHGTGASLHTWEAWATELRATRRVIRMDLPAYGLTGPFPDGNYSMTHYVRFMTHLLDTLGVKRFVVVGNSFGGELAWRTTLVLPGRVAQLVLVDASSFASTPTAVPIGFRLARVTWLAPLLRNVLPRRVIEQSVKSVYGDTTKVTDETVARYADLTRRAGNRTALTQRIAQSIPGKGTDQLRTITAPTLILWGRKDRLIPVENAEKLHAAIAGSTVVVFDDLGHVPQEEDPARSFAPVRTFLRIP